MVKGTRAKNNIEKQYSVQRGGNYAEIRPDTTFAREDYRRMGKIEVGRTILGPATRKAPAHNRELGRPRDRVHQGLRKAESSIVIQLRSEKRGFAVFLRARRAPDVVSPACQCGWR